MGDELPDGTVRGWTDLVAAGLSAGLAPRGETLEYANLAIRGRLLRPIVTTQLDAALALRPAADLLTFNGGGNDMMRPGVDLAELVAQIEQAVRRCLEAGVRPGGAQRRRPDRAAPVRAHHPPPRRLPHRGDRRALRPARHHLRERLRRRGDPRPPVLVVGPAAPQQRRPPAGRRPGPARAGLRGAARAGRERGRGPAPAGGERPVLPGARPAVDPAPGARAFVG
ncbi:GDSL-type esterase/lipase family protein [Actinoplanes nipponensis]|uniref:GDSL-type esterase/lipase family protein n=1 Tax=Actinoplanes nipponensis TaxID=135950 RepID=UPI003F68D988